MQREQTVWSHRADGPAFATPLPGHYYRHLRTPWRFMVDTGVRIGEALAIVWSDVDLDRRTVTVSRTLDRIEQGVPCFGDPNTAKSRRLVTLIPATAAVVGAHRVRQVEERLAASSSYAANNLVFASPAGLPLMRQTVLRHLRRVLASAGLAPDRLCSARPWTAPSRVASRSRKVPAGGVMERGAGQ